MVLPHFLYGESKGNKTMRKKQAMINQYVSVQQFNVAVAELSEREKARILKVVTERKLSVPQMNAEVLQSQINDKEQ